MEEPRRGGLLREEGVCSLAAGRRPLSSSSILGADDAATACVIRCRYPSRRRKKKGTEVEQRNDSGRVSHPIAGGKAVGNHHHLRAVIKDMSEMNNTTCNRLHSQQIPPNLVIVVVICSVLFVRFSLPSLCGRRPRRSHPIPTLALVFASSRFRVVR